MHSSSADLDPSMIFVMPNMTVRVSKHGKPTWNASDHVMNYAERGIWTHPIMLKSKNGDHEFVMIRSIVRIQ